ncbi:MotA/TolQ/ExbB proton channel family protein [Sinimarinibacterium sp. NLF-5-8]|uniref:MotA/TolQ/ExbB proton channel family protein n=1 Tax=Sinimarinibacterium sp. NLF-5-8 TaxID=2698684 RepID=UPI00137BF3D7|nr:MotA/TolQ/ExbB proton channel family protein [Sinimarinibacterium sp. NLF-5-8]QHS11159.1 MotA/TolQ/ExbB proton channel family protein [Sinimarinibacterium sp. NLF-5-8]
MAAPLEVFADIRDLLELGGPVVQVLLGAAFLLWVLIMERWLYSRRELPRMIEDLQRQWDARSDHASWHARQVKRKLVSEATRHIRGSLGLIKALVALASLIGLLGTVTGMIQVFDVMATLGTGNARAMASGVSAATIPTMAGMVVSISGLYPILWLEKKLAQETSRLNDHMITN